MLPVPCNSANKRCTRRTLQQRMFLELPTTHSHPEQRLFRASLHGTLYIHTKRNPVCALLVTKQLFSTTQLVQQKLTNMMCQILQHSLHLTFTPLALHLKQLLLIKYNTTRTNFTCVFFHYAMRHLSLLN